MSKSLFIGEDVSSTSYIGGNSTFTTRYILFLLVTESPQRRVGRVKKSRLE
jgi:hypothetical protein